MTARRNSRWPRSTPRPWPRAWLGLAVLLALLGSGIPAVRAAEATSGIVPPGARQASLFAVPPPVISDQPGALLGSESLADRALPEGVRAWRIRYATTAPGGAPATAVATVLAPLAPLSTPRPVIAWNHGAVGLVQRCLPSAQPNPWLDIPALAEVVARGWVVVATDYQTNSAGIHPFLIGEGEAHSTLDAVRAVRQLPGLSVANQTIVWGHSQGGHAALWTSMIAPTYAPELVIDGVVAISPATALASLLNRQHESAVAPILASWIAAAYSAYYPDVAYNAIVSSAALVFGRELASLCPPEPVDGLAIALLLRDLNDEPLLNVPAPDAFRARLVENEPNGDFAAPAVIVQGLDDTVILPEVTGRFVAARCAAGATIAYWTMPGQNHLSLVQPGSPLDDALIEWTQKRFAGHPPESGCSEAIIAG